jgi:hypothetical protein
MYLGTLFTLSYSSIHPRDAGLGREAAVEVESAPARISLVPSHGLGRGSLPLRPELAPVVHSTHERLTRRFDFLLYNT